MTENVRYERMHTPQRSYLMWVDDRVVAVLSMVKGGSWTATTTSRPRLRVSGGQTHHEAAMALLGKLNEQGIRNG